MQKKVEFCHRFDPFARSIQTPRTGGAFPSRLTIFGVGADTLSDELHNVLSGWDSYKCVRTSDFCEMTRCRNTDWETAIPLVRRLSKNAGFEFVEVIPKLQSADITA